jgi:hypothetical protein
MLPNGLAAPVKSEPGAPVVGVGALVVGAAPPSVFVPGITVSGLGVLGLSAVSLVTLSITLVFEMTTVLVLSPVLLAKSPGFVVVV